MSSQCHTIGAVAIDPVDPEKIYVGWSILPCGFFITAGCGGALGEGGIEITRSGGSNWAALDIPIAPFHVSAIAISSSDPETIYAGADVGWGGIFKSGDGAVTWSMLGDLIGASALQLDPARGVIYAATDNGVFEYGIALRPPDVVPNGQRPREVPSRP